MALILAYNIDNICNVDSSWQNNHCTTCGIYFGTFEEYKAHLDDCPGLQQR